MIRSIVSTGLKFRFLAIVLAAAMIAFGLVQLRSMPVDVLPEFSPPYVEIQTEALGLSTEEVEQFITVPMEQTILSGVAWIDTVYSESVPGLSSILLLFEPGTDVYRARQMVSERLSQALVGLPHVSKPPTMIQPRSSSSRFLIVGLTPKDVSLIETSVLARWVVAPRLMGVAGVANVAIWGQRERQLQVQADPELLRARGVSLRQVLQTTGNALWVSTLSYLPASTPGTGGLIDTPNQRINVWHVLPISSPDELAQVPIEGAPGLRLSDVAKVVEDHQPLIGDALTDSGPGLLLVIEKLPGANTLEVTRGVEEALAALGPGLKGIDVDTSLFRPASFIETAVGNLRSSLLAAAIILVAAVLLLLWSWRAALIALFTIPASLMTALFVLYLRGETMNVMVLAGLAIAIGAIIDDVIVDLDNIMRHLRQERRAGSNGTLVTVIVDASHRTRRALFVATLILLLATVPLFVPGGVTGAFLQPLALSYLLAIFASMAVAMIITPGLSLILFAHAPLKRGASPLLSWVRTGYDWALARSVRSPALPLIGIALLAIAVLAAVPLLRQRSWLPAFKEGDILIEWEGAPGTSRPAMERIVSRASSELRALPGVRSVGAHIGRAVFGDQVVGINSAQLWVSIDPAADHDATLTAVRETIADYPGLAKSVSSNVEQALGQAMPGTSGVAANDDITVRVFGQEPAVLQDLAENVRQSVSGIQGVGDLAVRLPIEEPTVQIEVDIPSAQSHGIKPGDVRRAVATMISGIQVGSLFEEQKIFDVVVWSTPETRASVAQIRELLIERPGGGYVRLADVADVRIAPVPTVIRRASISPYLDVAVKVAGRSPAAVASDVKAAIQGLQYPLEYHAEVLSGYAERQVGLQQILLAVGLAVAGIFLLLQAVSGSWGFAALALLALPASLAGGLLMMVLSGPARISLGSVAGLFLVFSIAVRNTVMLIDHYRHLEEVEGVAFGPELVGRGTRERIIATMATALTTALVLTPFVVFGNVPGHEILYPMAIVTWAGLLTATFVNLFVLPALYLRFGARREPDLGLVPPTPVATPGLAGGN